jgi:hypothetical protein
MTRLQTLKLIQIALALPAYTVPASTTFVFTLWSVIAFLIAVHFRTNNRRVVGSVGIDSRPVLTMGLLEHLR